jgi:hypothetical protein
MIVPRPLSGCQIKAKIKDFLLMYHLFQYKHRFLPNFELKHFPDSAFTPCMGKNAVDFVGKNAIDFVGKNPALGNAYTTKNM